MQRPTGVRHLVVLFAIALAVVTYVDRVAISFAAPYISKDLGLDTRQMGAVFAAFGWAPTSVADPEDRATFRAARLRWDERDDEPHRSILAWHRALLALRRREPALTDGRLDLVQADADDVHAGLVVRRGHELKLVYPQAGAAPEDFAGLDFERFSLQPMDGPDVIENTARTVDYCLRHPQWRLSLQTHKTLGIR